MRVGGWPSCRVTQNSVLLSSYRGSPIPSIIHPVPSLLLGIAVLEPIKPPPANCPVRVPLLPPLRRTNGCFLSRDVLGRRLILLAGGRCRLVHRLGTLDRLLWAQLDCRADVLKVEVELVDKIENILGIEPLDILAGGELEYYVNVGYRVSGVANRLHRHALVGVVTLV